MNSICKSIGFSVGKMVLAGFLATPLYALTNPSQVLMKIEEVRLSPNADCSAPVSVFSTASPTPEDMVSNPTLGRGAIPNGVYRCLMIHMSDEITYTPAQDDGTSCLASTTYTRDIFRTGDSSTAPDGSLIAGRGASAQSGTEDFPWTYFSTGGSHSNTCYQPSSPCVLSSPIVVSGDHTSTFVMDFDNQIDGSGSFCDLAGVTMSAR